MSQSAGVGFRPGFARRSAGRWSFSRALIGLLMGVLSHWLWSHRGHAQVLRTRTT